MTRTLFALVFVGMTTTLAAQQDTETGIEAVATLTDDQSPSPADAANDFYGVPWSGSGIGELRIHGEQWFWTSYVVPYEGQIESIRQYLIGSGACSYGCGDGGVIKWAAHRDVNGTPGPEVTSVTLSARRVTDARNNVNLFASDKFEQPLRVSKGERIWISASNLHADPTRNYISLDPFYLQGRSADPDSTRPVSSVDPEDRQLTVYDRNHSLIRNRHMIGAVYYADGRTFGNGYTMSAPHVGTAADKWEPVGGSRKVRQQFTPHRDLVFESVDLRVYLSMGSAPLTVTIRQGGQVVASGSAAAWTEGGWGWNTDGRGGWTNEWNAVVNAQWGSLVLPRTQLRAGVPAEIELSAPAGTEYQAVGVRYGSNYMPGAYYRWPQAESTDDGSSWVGWGPTEHLSFFFRLVKQTADTASAHR